MKIFVITRTRNEAHNIQLFCQAYGWVDRILIADAMSEDNSVLLAREFNNVEVRPFDVWRQYGKLWLSPQAQHINFLIEWATEDGADWIIFDDPDCWPNYYLREHGRHILESAKSINMVLVTRLYLWGNDKFFPALSQLRGPGLWEPSLWAWRPEIGLGAIEEQNYHYRLNQEVSRKTGLPVMPPSCLLHNPWPDEIAVRFKMERYRKSGHIDMQHPLEFGGPLKDLPEWAHL